MSSKETSSSLSPTTNSTRITEASHKLADSTAHTPVICGYCGQTGHAIAACDVHKRDFVPRSRHNDNEGRSWTPRNSNFRHGAKPYDRSSSDRSSNYSRQNGQRSNQTENKPAENSKA